MRTAGKILAGISAILFVITGVLALLLFNIERKAFSAETYKQAFESQKLYERMPGILADALATSIAQDQNSNALLSKFSEEDWAASIASLLPPEELKAMSNDTLDSVFDYLNNQSDSAAISLLPLKKHLAGPAGMDALLGLMSTQPACSTEQLIQMTLGALTGGEFILCNPPDEILGLITPLVETQLQFMTVAIPDEITLISAAQSGTPDDPRIQLNRVRKVMKLTPLLPLIFLIGITIFAVRGLRDWLMWWGLPFMFTGGISLLIALLGSPIIGLVIRTAMQEQGSGFVPPILLPTLQETIGEVARQILMPVAVEGLTLAILGMGMIMIAWYLAKREKDQITKRLNAPNV